MKTNDEIVGFIESKADQKVFQLELEEFLGMKLSNNTNWRARLFRINYQRKLKNLSCIRHFGRNSKQPFYYLEDLC